MLEIKLVNLNDPFHHLNCRGKPILSFLKKEHESNCFAIKKKANSLIQEPQMSPPMNGHHLYSPFYKWRSGDNGKYTDVLYVTPWAAKADMYCVKINVLLGVRSI